MDNFSKLKHPSLPPHEACYNSLKVANITHDTYSQEVWNEEKMSSVI